MIRREVVITGVGAVSSFGVGLEDLAVALRHSAPRLTEVDRSAGYHDPDGSRYASLIGTLNLSAHLPTGAARRMSPPSRFAVAAARLALASAGLETERVATAETGVVLSTAFGPASFSERLFRSVVTDGAESASPSLFTECVANAPAAQVAITCAATGPNITVVQREAGALLALGRGTREVSTGRMDRALVGVVDELPPIVHGLLDRYRAVARASDGAAEQARPFDRFRNGFVASDGATILVLEEEGAARARGAPLLARVRGFGGAFDRSASRVGWGTGVEALQRGLQRLLDRAEVNANDVSFILSGASGAIAGDRLEARVLRAVFRDVPPVVAPKGVTGEYGGGFLASLVLAMRGADFGSTAGFEVCDPEIGLVPHAGGPLPAPRTLVASSLAAGGAASWVIVSEP